MNEKSIFWFMLLVILVPGISCKRDDPGTSFVSGNVVVVSFQNGDEMPCLVRVWRKDPVKDLIVQSTDDPQARRMTITFKDGLTVAVEVVEHGRSIQIDVEGCRLEYTPRVDGVDIVDVCMEGRSLKQVTVFSPARVPDFSVQMPRDYVEESIDNLSQLETGSDSD